MYSFLYYDEKYPNIVKVLNYKQNHLPEYHLIHRNYYREVFLKYDLHGIEKVMDRIIYHKFTNNIRGVSSYSVYYTLKQRELLYKANKLKKLKNIKKLINKYYKLFINHSLKQSLL